MTTGIKNKNTFLPLGGQKQKPTKIKEYFNIRVFNIFFLFLFIVTGFLYLTQVNALAVKGYIIRDLEVTLEEQKLVAQDLEFKSQEQQSTDRMAIRVAELNLVSVDQIKYIQVPSSEVAVAR